MMTHSMKANEEKETNSHIAGIQRNGTLRGSMAKKVSAPIVPPDGFKSPAHRHSAGYASQVSSSGCNTIDRNSLCDNISVDDVLVTNMSMSNSTLQRGTVNNNNYNSVVSYASNNNNNFVNVPNRPSQLLTASQPSTGRPLANFSYPNDANTIYAQAIVHHPRPVLNNFNCNNNTSNGHMMNNINNNNPYAPTMEANIDSGFSSITHVDGLWSYNVTRQLVPTVILSNGSSASEVATHKNHYRVFLEDQGIEVGRESPSGSSSSCTSSSTSSTGSRNSTASLDSGRVSGTDTKQIQFHRLSVHSCESVNIESVISGNHSSSSSSLGSGTGSSMTTESDQSSLNTPTSGAAIANAPVPNVAEMILHGLPDMEILQAWLLNIHLEDYASLFSNAGYDMPTISRMTPQDLTAIGITKPAHRRTLKSEIERLNIADGIPSYRPESLAEWLKLLRLEDYLDILCQQGYDTIDRVVELTWEDLEEVGIKKLGHQKRLMLAIKRIADLNNGLRRQPGQHSSNAVCHSTLSSSSSTSLSSCPSGNRSAHPNSYLPVQSHPVQYQGEEIVINTANRGKTSTTSPTREVPTTPELKTFQQVPGFDFSNKSSFDGFMMTRQLSEGHYSGMMQPPVQTTRGRSLESLDREESGFNKVVPGYGHRYPHRYMHRQQSDWRTSGDHGYETDSEILSNQNTSAYYMYEIDGTATLHRPKGLIKNKPIAKIAAKTRQPDNSCSYESIYESQKKQNSGSTCSLDEKQSLSVNQSNKCLNDSNANWCNINDTRSSSSNCNAYRLTAPNEGPTHSQIYATLQRKKNPPPVPRRTNSMKGSSSGSHMMGLNGDQPSSIPARCSSLEAMQEQAFATCVKSLASRFSMNSSEELPPLPTRNHTITPMAPSPTRPSECEFPPPPSPLPFDSYSAKEDDSSFEFNTLPRRPNSDTNDQDREANISSSSSTESMPFANDNIGTIKQRATITTASKPPSPTSSVMSAPASVTNSPSATLLRKPKNVMISSQNFNHAHSNVSTEHQSSCNGSAGSKPLTRLSNASSPNKNSSGDVIDDIETMLANLSNQLDLMLENEMIGN